MKKICLIVSILLLSLLMAFSVGAKCASGCVYSTSPFCDVCGEQIEGECTGSHVFESGYCLICGAFDDSQEDWCPVNQGQHNVLLGSCTHCGKVFCYHTDMSELHVVTKATCKDTGYGYRLCLDCGAEYGETIARTAHDYKNGVCIACGLGCSHVYGDCVVTKEPNCITEGSERQECIICGYVKKSVISALGHNYVNAKCQRCGVIQDGHVHAVCRTVILSEETHVSLCSCGYLYIEQDHAFVEKYTIPPIDKYKPMFQKVACSECGYERVFYKMNPAVKNHTIENGEKISYNSLFANDCLYYEYTDENGGECEFFVVSDNNGMVLERIVLPTLSAGEKLLVDTETGYYSVWDDEVSKIKLDVLDWRVQSVQDVYFNFSPDLEEVPTELSVFNAYFESDYLKEYNYPSVDSSLIGSGYDHIHPYIDRGSGKNIRLISFPQENISEFRADLASYPLTLVIYDFLDQSYESVTNKDDAFTSAFVKMKQNNGMSNGYTPSGGTYEQGYADAYNMLTNAMIEEAPIQGFIQGMWYGVLSFITILGNGISIGGISLFSILITALILVVVAFVLKLLFKGAG